MRQSLLELVARKYPVIAKDLLGPLLELIGLSRRYCGGDIDKFLVLLVVAARTVEHPDFAAYSPEDLASGRVPVFPSLGTNARSISASLHIPKETVRRKVAELLEAGWLVREGHNLYYTAHAHRQLAPVREAVERTAVRFFEVIAPLARDTVP